MAIFKTCKLIRAWGIPPPLNCPKTFFPVVWDTSVVCVLLNHICVLGQQMDSIYIVPSKNSLYTLDNMCTGCCELSIALKRILKGVVTVCQCGHIYSSLYSQSVVVSIGHISTSVCHMFFVIFVPCSILTMCVHSYVFQYPVPLSLTL